MRRMVWIILAAVLLVAAHPSALSSDPSDPPKKPPPLDPGKARDLTALSLALDPSITPPEVDLAVPIPPRLLKRVVVVRVTKTGFLPAFVLPGGRFVKVENLDALHDLLRAEADRSREDDFLRASNLDLLILADRRAPWARFGQVCHAAASPDVRIGRYWFGTRGRDGKLTAFPIEFPKERGLMPSPTPENLARAVKRTVRVAAKKRTGGFTDKDLLYRWCYDLWKSSPGRRVGLRMVIEPTAPCETGLALMNEVRRFSFDWIWAWVRWRESIESAAKIAYFSVGDEVPVIRREVPALRPGAAPNHPRTRCIPTGGQASP